jgi:hypothetical protein
MLVQLQELVLQRAQLQIVIDQANTVSELLL